MVASLSLSPLFTDPAASRPPGERECGGLSLSHRWSLIRLHPVRRGKGRKCIVSPFDDAEAARPDLWYTPFSLTKLRRNRAYATCSQIRPPLFTLLHPDDLQVSPPALLHYPFSHVAACGSSIVLCPKHSSSSVLSILHSRPHTVLDKHNRVVIFP